MQQKGASLFCPKLWNGTSLDSSPGDGKTGQVSYQCELEDGRIIRRHIDHLGLRQHTSDRVIRKDHTNTPKKDSTDLEGKERGREIHGRAGVDEEQQRSDVGLDQSNTLPERPEEERATEQNEPFLQQRFRTNEDLGER